MRRLQLRGLAVKTFCTLQNRNYRLFWSGQVFSLSGNWMQVTAESWLVYRVTGSAAVLGIVGFISLLPVIPISFFGSALIDRFPRRNLVLCTQAALAGTALAWAVLAWRGNVQLWELIALSFVEGAIGSIDLPARQAFLSDMVGRDALPNCIALNTLLFNLGRIVGPLLAGWVIARTGEGTCFVLNGVSFVPLMLGLVLMRNLRRDETTGGKNGSGSVGHGLLYLRRNPTLIWLIALMAVSSLFLLSYLLLLPVVAKDVLAAGPEGLGMLMTSVGVGATLGSLWLANVGEDRQRRWLIVVLYLLPASIFLFSTARSLAVAMAIGVVVGANTTWMQTTFNTLVQLQVRDDMRGRTMSTYLAVQIGMQRVGAMGAGVLAEFVGVPMALQAGAVASLVCTSIALRLRPSLFRGQPPTRNDTVVAK